jgi:hypothetical protein
MKKACIFPALLLGTVALGSSASADTIIYDNFTSATSVSGINNSSFAAVFQSNIVQTISGNWRARVSAK